MGLDSYFDTLGATFFAFYKQLKVHGAVKFMLTEAQQTHFYDFFSQVLQRYLGLKGEAYLGTVRRLGLSAFRIAMVLSSVRLISTPTMPHQLVCEDVDFHSALSIAQVLIQHASHVFNQLSETEQTLRPPGKRERFYAQLPHRFNRQGYLEVATSLGIKDKTAQNYVAKFIQSTLLHRDEKDAYIKSPQEGMHTVEAISPTMVS